MKVDEHSFIITVEDLARIAKKRRKFLLKVGALGLALGLVFSFTRPLRFKAEASFLDGAVQSPIAPFASILSNFNSGPNDNSALFIMQSRAVLEQVVKELGLQASVQGYPSQGALKNILDNLQYSLLGKTDDSDGFTFGKVRFDQGGGKKYLLRFVDENHFTISETTRDIVANGSIGEEIFSRDFQLTLLRTPRDLKIGRDYKLLLHPLESAVDPLRSSFEIRLDKKDKKILWLYYAHRNKERAAEIVNQITASFLDYVREDHEKLAETQLAFLNQRKSKLERDFDQALHSHIHYLQDNISKTGFVEVKQQIELMSKPRLELESKYVALNSLEGNLKKVQANYARAIGIPFLPKEELLAGPGSKISLQPWTEDKERFWPEQFAGIDLETAKGLHTSYQQNLDRVETEIDKVEFILPSLHRKDFEIHALSALAQDQVTAALAQNASNLELSLRDEGNRSQKDMNRLEESLKSQREFIEAHLRQSLALHKQQARTIQSKLASLRATMLKLIEEERGVILAQLSLFQQQLSALPERWGLEKQLEINGLMMQKIMEGMTQMIEGKVVEHHLKHTSSKLIDSARPPSTPFRTSPLKIMVLFAFLGVAGSYFLFLVHTIWKGIPLSFSTAYAYGLPVSGKLTLFRGAAFEELRKHDLETTRKTIDFIETNAHLIGGTAIALIGKNQRGFAFNLAHLLSWQNKNILAVDLSFSQRIPADAETGILHFLQGKSDEWTATKKDGYDWLPSCGTTRFATELLRSERFERFIDQAKERYERIVLICEAPLDSSEIHLLTRKSDLSIVALENEPYDFLAKAGVTKIRKATFIFNEG